MKHFFWLIAAVLIFAGCTAPGRAAETLQASGFTDIQTGGRSFFVCGENDVTATKFTATNPLGKRVQGTVCCKGFWFGGCTVRF